MRLNLPEPVDAVIRAFHTCEFATVVRDGTPIVWPTVALYLTERAQFLVEPVKKYGLRKADFQLYPDHKGTTTAAPGTMTIKFCRSIQLAGDLTGARITAQITKTMLQFSNIHKVVILTKDGGCFNDFQGANACLN